MARLFRAILFVFGVAFSASAQAPNAQQKEIQRQADLVSLRVQLNYQKLQSLQEFRDYLADQAAIQKLQQDYQAAETKPDPKAKPSPTK